MLAWAFLLRAVGIPKAHNVPQLQNPGFEAPVAKGAPIPGWDVSVGNGASGILFMNSQNDPERITTASHGTDLKGSEFPFLFEPFTVTLLELKLDRVQKQQ
jgi:hypothetical protein